MTENEGRRPIRSRRNPLVKRFAAWLARVGISPNAISVLSVVFAAAGAAALYWGSWWGPTIVTPACIVLRLLCNMFDGMVAVEQGRQTPTGPLFNEVPDRIADTFLIVALGYFCEMAVAGWLGALLALATAYIRVLGGSLGLAERFHGPMAKPHRMWTMAFLLPLTWPSLGLTPMIALFLIVTGSVLTCAIRLWVIRTELVEKAAAA